MTIINFNNQKAAHDAAQAKVEQETRNRAVWERDILPNYDVKDLEANFRIAVSYCQGELSLSRFEFMLQHHPQHGLVFGDERNELLAEIQELITDNYGRTLAPAEIKYKMGKYVYQDRMQLRQSLKDLQAAKAARAKTIGQLREEVREARKPEQRPYPGYPTLLSTLVPRGQIQAVSTRDYLNHIAAKDFEEFRRFIKIYGSTQIDDIRMGRRY